jgi:hypothetical protein
MDLKEQIIQKYLALICKLNEHQQTKNANENHPHFYC